MYRSGERRRQVIVEREGLTPGGRRGRDGGRGGPRSWPRIPRWWRTTAAGKKAALGFLVGQVMKATEGSANPALVNACSRRNFRNCKWLSRMWAGLMIRLQHVSKVFGKGPACVPALSDISFSVDKGEFVVLNGASGAGKTTLLRLLYRDELPSDGEIVVADRDVTRLRRSQISSLRRSIGVVFQDAKLLDGRTVFENVAFVLRVLGTPRREITPRAFAVLKAVGLSARAQAYPHQLSQGEAQRVSLARALVKSPALLLADEPTGNLDDEMGAEILDLLKEIWTRGTTVLLATHQARVASQLKRRTLTLEGGHLLKDEG